MIWLNGHLIEAGAVPAEDRGFLLGDGLFETILITDGRPCFVQDHLERLARSAEELSIAIPVDVKDGIGEVIAAARAQEGALRLTLSRGIASHRGLWPKESGEPTLLITFTPLQHTHEPAIAMIAEERRLAGSALSRLKTLSYLPQILAQKEAIEAGCDEALMLNQHSHLTGAARANLFLASGSCLVTPRIEDGALPGITRARLLALATQKGWEVQERAVNPNEIGAADEVFLSNSLFLIRPIVRLGVWQWAPGEKIAALRAELMAAM